MKRRSVVPVGVCVLEDMTQCHAVERVTSPGGISLPAPLAKRRSVIFAIFKTIKQGEN